MGVRRVKQVHAVISTHTSFGENGLQAQGQEVEIDSQGTARSVNSGDVIIDSPSSNRLLSAVITEEGEIMQKDKSTNLPAELTCECNGHEKTGGSCTDYNHNNLWCYVDEGVCPNSQKGSLPYTWSEEPCGVRNADPCECTGEATKGGTCTDYNSPSLWCYVVESSCPNAQQGSGGKWSEAPCKVPATTAAATTTVAATTA